MPCLKSVFHRCLQDGLLENEHFAGSTEVVGGECVEIESTRDRLTERIFAIPIGCPRTVQITAHRLMSQRQGPNRLPICRVDGQRDIGSFSEPIRYPRLRVEWIGVIPQQDCFFWRRQLSFKRLIEDLNDSTWVIKFHDTLKLFLMCEQGGRCTGGLPLSYLRLNQLEVV